MKNYTTTLQAFSIVMLSAVLLLSCGNKQAKQAEELQAESKEQAFQEVNQHIRFQHHLKLYK